MGVWERVNVLSHTTKLINNIIIAQLFDANLCLKYIYKPKKQLWPIG